ncbi:sensor histidine kinase [uncultured Sphingomonas sp.]|uniref:sensor histidine kinase n=1 Tax=uncultured Sphingomonas sp. TaxID=158754 RepID=UPI0035CC06A0
MARIGELDLPDRLAPTVPRWVTQLSFALLCAAAATIIRIVINAIAPGSAIFALVFPAIMVATLFGRWQSGLLTTAITVFYTYFAAYRGTPAAAAVASPSSTLFAILATAMLTVALAELFRRAVRRATQERDREIAERDLLLAEFDHRVKNNFAIVAGVLDIQRRRVTEPAAAEALTSALMRVESVARAHRHLYRNGQAEMVDIRDYLVELCGALADALLLRGGVTLTCDADQAPVGRDRAVSMGLVINELVTNAAKHAFIGRDSGTIGVSWRRHESGAGWRLMVTDDGVGMPERQPASRRDGGLGQRLIEAFAQQARGTLSSVSDATGTRVTLDIPD